MSSPAPTSGGVDPHLASEREKQYQRQKNAATKDRKSKFEEMAADSGDTGPVVVAGGNMNEYMSSVLPSLDETDSPRADGTPKVVKASKPPPPTAKAYDAETRRASSHIPSAIVAPLVGSCADSGQRPITVFEGFKHTVKKHGKRNALMYKLKHEDPYTAVSWDQYFEETLKFARALVAINFNPHASVNILGYNSCPWFYCEMGCIAAGGMAAGIYQTNMPEAVAYIMSHSDCEVLCVDEPGQLKKVSGMIAEGKFPKLKAVVQWAGEMEPKGTKFGTVPFYSYNDFVALGVGKQAEVDARLKIQNPGHCCSLIYTSGTTGPPKAVMISHDNAVWTSSAAENCMGGGNVDDRLISYLPLSHIAAQMLDIFLPMLTGACVYFALPDALRGTLALQLQCVKPTLFFGVPRVWEKIYEKMMAIGKKTTGALKKAATWAKQKGTERNQRAQYGHKDGGMPLSWVMAHLILKKIHKALGLNKCRGCFTGAAPIALNVLQYFASLDIPIYELFGQSECTGPHTMNFP